MKDPLGFAVAHHAFVRLQHEHKHAYIHLACVKRPELSHLSNAPEVPSLKRAAILEDKLRVEPIRSF